MALLKAENISVSFDGNKILENIDIELNAGELVSILGLSGSGKTTLFNVIAGLIKPDEGRVLLDDEDITGRTGYVSYMLQKDLLLPYRTIIDNVAMPLMISGMKRKQAREKAKEYFSVFGLNGCEKLYPAQLSGGMRQRAALLRTYMMSGRAELLDEPFSALDAITKSHLHEWYIGVMRRIKLSTLFITHDIDEAILLSDRIYVLGERPGRILKEICIDPADVRCEGLLLKDSFLSYKREILSEIK